MRRAPIVLTAIALVQLRPTGPDIATANPRWEQKPKPGAYTKWPLPAAGASQSGAPEIVFTFDDGPHRTYTPQILEALGEHGIKAVFFWVGWRVTKESPRRPARRALVDRVVREGHVVANHTFRHVHLCKVSRDRAAAEIDDTRAIYEELAGMPVPMFRAPYGNHCPRLVEMLEARGIDHLHWDIDPMEWTDHDGKRVAGTIRRWITRYARKNRRGVIIMHDTRRASATALPIVLDWLARENQRRARRGEPEIRVLDGSDLALEMMDPELADWATATAGAAATRLADGLARLVP